MEPKRADFRKGDIVGHIPNLRALGRNQHGFNLLGIRSSPDPNREPRSRPLHDRGGEVDAARLPSSELLTVAYWQASDSYRVATFAIHVGLASQGRRNGCGHRL
jgi:hypothetical protein